MALSSSVLGLNPAFSKTSIVLNAKSRHEAGILVSQYADLLCEWAFKFGLYETVVKYPGCKRPYRLLAEMASINRGEVMSEILSVLSSGIYIAECRLSLPLLNVLTEFAENPEKRRGLVRLNDEQQIALTESCQANIKNATVKSAVTRKRREYWHLPDLEEFNRLSQQVLEPNNPDSFFEFRWRGVDVTRTNWRMFVNRYRLITDAFGELYHVSETLGVEPAKTPISC